MKKYSSVFIVLLIIILLLIFSNLLLSQELNRKSKFTCPEVDLSNFISIDENKDENEEEMIEEIPLKKYVDIKGAVKKPGVYLITEGDRVTNLISLSGGLQKEADTSSVNLSKILEDETVITIPFIVVKKEEVVGENEVIVPIQSGKVSLNKGSIMEFQTLSGIGQGKAQDIIDYRIENGIFNNIEELMNVPGIGESTFAKIKEDITI